MTARKAGAIAILIPMIMGCLTIWSTVVSGITRWNFIESKVIDHETKIQGIQNLYKLNCIMAIEVIKNKNKLREFCSGI